MRKPACTSSCHELVFSIWSCFTLAILATAHQPSQQCFFNVGCALQPRPYFCVCVQDKEALQQQVALLKLASQDDVVAVQKQLADAIAERDVALDQIKTAEQQAAAETAHRVRIEGTVHDLQQQLSRQTAEASKAQQTCKKLQEQVQMIVV